MILDLMLQFGLLSLLAFGGAGAVLPEMHRIAVESRHWMDEATFTHLVAISQAAPGPNSVIVTLIGWHVAGATGALAATVAMCGPPALIILVLMRYWGSFEGARWQVLIQNALTPLAVGLVLASGCIVARGADHGHASHLATATTIALILRTKVHPLWLIAIGAVLGGAGMI